MVASSTFRLVLGHLSMRFLQGSNFSIKGERLLEQHEAARHGRYNTGVFLLRIWISSPARGHSLHSPTSHHRTYAS